MKAPIMEMLSDIQKQQIVNLEIYPVDARKELICLLEGLTDICDLVKCSHNELSKAIKLLSSVKTGSKSHRFTSKETQKLYGGMSNLDRYIDMKMVKIFGKSVPPFYKNNGGRRKYGQALKDDLKTIAQQIYEDISSGVPGEVALEEYCKDNVLIVAEQMKKCGVAVKGDWKAELNRYFYRNIDDEMKQLFDEVYQKSKIFRYLPDYTSIYFAGEKVDPIKVKYLYFTFFVRPNGKYDLKNRDGWKDPGFIFNGEIIRKDVPGNVLYGYFGTAMGFSEIELLSAGGIVQVATFTAHWDNSTGFFDDPHDQKYVKLGIELFKQDHGKDMFEVMQQEIEQEKEALEKELRSLWEEWFIK